METDKIKLTPLESYSLDKITAAIILDGRRSKDENLYPVKYRITFMRKQVYYTSGIDLTFDEWQRLPEAKGKNLKQQRELIKAGFDKIKNHIIDLRNGEGFSLERLNVRLSRGLKNSIITAFETKVEKLRKAGKIGTSEWYSYSLKSLQGFAGRDLKFAEITKDFLERYESHLTEKGKSYTTISMYMRALQAIMNDGKREGVINQAQYPFGKDKYEIPEETGRKLALTIDQIGKISRYPLLTDSEKRCRDLWLFLYLANGMNVVDLLQLRFSNIVNDRLTYYRQKTIHSKKKRQITVIVVPQMREIIDRWGNLELSDSYIFPFLRKGLSPVDERRIVKNVTSLINKKMRRIGQSLGYGKVSTYWSRHSYATVLKRAGANISAISEALGHSDTEVTQNYLDSIEETEMRKNAEIISNF